MQSLMNTTALACRGNMLVPRNRFPKAFPNLSFESGCCSSHLPGLITMSSLREVKGAKSKKRHSCVSRAMSNKGSFPDGYLEVKLDSVRVSSGSSVVFLRLIGQTELILPVHIGETESSALLKEINKQPGMRPLTHDLTKNLLLATGYRVLKIMITELVNSTYFSRIHLGRVNEQGEVWDEVDVDSRPSDAINLAVRFGAPMYISRQIAAFSTSYPKEGLSSASSSQSETNAEIVRSVKETMASFEDPTTMLQLQKDLAVKEERYTDARAFQQQIFEHMTHSTMLRMIVAMEAALADGRYDEAARVRDEYRQAVETGGAMEQAQENMSAADRKQAY